MQCPKCGSENPNHAQTCILCGCDLTSPFDPTKQKTSKIAIVSLVLAVLSIFPFLLTALPAIILGCVALTRIRRSKGRLKGENLAITAIAVPIIAFPVVLFVLHSLWKLDAPPIPNDYTIANLRSAPEDCADSYQLLLSLSKEQGRPDAPAIGLSADDVNLIRKLHKVLREGTESQIAETLHDNEKTFELAWDKTKKARVIISKLNRFDEIADLTEPAVGSKHVSLFNLVDLASLTQAHVYIQIEQDHIQTVLSELIEIDSVVRKLSVNARSTITKLVCWAYMGTGIETANYIANNPNVSRQSLQVLAKHFTPLTSDQLSLRDSVLFEYLFFKSIITQEMGQNKLGTPSTFKRNSVLRLYRNYCDGWIAAAEGPEQSERPEFSVWPSVWSWLGRVSFRPEERLPLIYKCYNPTGSMLIKMFFNIRFDKESAKSTNIKVQDDLLQIVINKRLGRKVILKARAYSDEYIVDIEGRKIFSPGPDGKIDTNDDIKLPINPEVLGWEN